MSGANKIPTKRYGVTSITSHSDEAGRAQESLDRLGYAVVDSGLSPSQVSDIGDRFNQVRHRYADQYGAGYLKDRDEHNTIRAMLLQDDETFLNLACNAALHRVLALAMPGKYILNQQNGIINPPGQEYNQGAWHRDLPYQHFVSTRPLAINALYCVDDFTLENGATFVLPASHLRESFPSDEFVSANAMQVAARAGQFIVLDCMLFHAGGSNRSQMERRAVNHVFTIPLIKQQVLLQLETRQEALSEFQADLLGIRYAEPPDVASYISRRPSKR